MWRRQVTAEEVDAVVADMKATADVLRQEAETRRAMSVRLSEVATRMEGLVARLEGSE